MCDVYGGIMPVRKVGQTHIWFTPWDYLIRWWGIQEAMIDLVERPELVHAGVERMVDAWMVELDQFVEQNLLALDCNNTRIGSGGYGYTSKLPGEDFDPTYVKPHNMWGCSNAQIFSEVSPQMHWEFALKHDLRWLERWGLTYYGCCEPLDRKIDILRRIPNLRKISVSPWCKTDRLIEKIGRRLRDEPQAQSRDLRRGRLASRAGAAGPAQLPREGPGLPRRADHEGHLDRPLSAPAAVGVGGDRDAGGRRVRELVTSSLRAATPSPGAACTRAACWSHPPSGNRRLPSASPCRWRPTRRRAETSE